ncbi:MAG: ABC transporter ATP-binding protein [Deltaproteobacteria bacterium]
MADKLFIKMNDVYKIFAINKSSVIKNIKTFKQTAISNENKANNFIALENINIEINEGERVGIIGPNGAGKSTLLSLIGGFAEQSSGDIKINGKINAIMTLGVGIREELTGIENIYTEGELHGKTKSEVDKLLNEIIEFADIGEYINKPVRTYSSGMKARLSFAMLSFVEPEILIIDEVLGVGDADFALKSAKKIQELCSKGKILIVVSHAMGTITSMADRTIWLDKGKIIMDGDSLSVTRAYIESVKKKEEEELNNKLIIRVETSKLKGAVKINDYYLVSSDMQKKTIFELYEELMVHVVIEGVDDLLEWDIRLSLIKMDGTLIMQNLASQDGAKLPPILKGNRINIDVKVGDIKFSEGVYEVLCEVLDSSGIAVAKEATVVKVVNLVIFNASKPDYYCKYEWIKGE